MVTRILVICLLFLIASVSWAQNDEELLPPEEAFEFSSEWLGNELIASWKIADGYYMYQDKFAVSSLTEGVQIGELDLPPGKEKDDPLFGLVTTYEDLAEVRIPLSLDGSVQEVKLEVWGQGCNEPVGVCYPPTKNDVSIPFISNASASETQIDSSEQNLTDSQAGSGLDPKKLSFLNIPSVTAENLLDVEDAFLLDVRAEHGELLNASLIVQEGYYIYRDKIDFQSSENVMLRNISKPDGDLMEDPYFGEQWVYASDVDFQIPLTRSSPESENMQLTVVYQGCAKDLICYPPVKKTFDIALGSLIGTANAAQLGGFVVPASSGSSTGWWIILTAFGTGLLLTFTPCVLPLIPILSSIVVGGEKGSNSRWRGGSLSLVYVFGTVIAYAFVGAVAGATGDQLQAYFQNAWSLSILSVVFVLMALSLFGMYEIRVPSFFETKIQESSMKLGGGKFGAVLVLGIISALVVSACVSPLLISVLGIAIAKADPVLGAAMMTSMALGMGVVLIAIGFGLGVVLPKAGAWMDKLKYSFGVMLLGVAIYLLGNIPAVPVLLLWGVLLIVTGVYLGAMRSLPANASGWQCFWKGIGLVVLIWGILTFIGGLTGSRDVLRPLPQITAVEPVQLDLASHDLGNSYRT